MPIETLSADTAEVRLLQAAPKMPEALRRGGVVYVWSPPKPSLEELQAADVKRAELQAWLRDYLAREGQDVPR